MKKSGTAKDRIGSDAKPLVARARVPWQYLACHWSVSLEEGQISGLSDADLTISATSRSGFRSLYLTLRSACDKIVGNAIRRFM